VTPPAWTVRLVEELNGADARASGVVEGLSEDQLNWRSRPDSWSIGQCLDHLLVTNRVYLPPMASALQRHVQGLATEIRIGSFGRWFIRRYADPVTPRTRARAPGKSKPSPGVDRSVADQLVASNEEARRFVCLCGDYDINRIRFVNPFVPLIRFTVGTGLEILVRHQRRHLAQAEGVRARLVG